MLSRQYYLYNIYGYYGACNSPDVPHYESNKYQYESKTVFDDNNWELVNEIIKQWNMTVILSRY